MTAPHVVVVGAGNAGLCAALAAAERGARVTVLEVAPAAERGGNSAFTSGAMRVTYQGVQDLRRLLPELTPDHWDRHDFGTYPESLFLADIARVSDNRCDPELAESLVSRSYETLLWLRQHGVSFLPTFGQQAFCHEGGFKFWGGLPVQVRGGGQGLVDTLVDAATRVGVRIRYEHRGVGLLTTNGAVTGIRVRDHGECYDLAADAVILASGGFEANAEWRARYLGANWDLARVRGTRFNVGDGIRMALDVDAMPWGNWSGCHAVAWDLNAPHFGTQEVGYRYQRHSYPFGIVVNAAGERFVDEGADFRPYTYAKHGREILRQPSMLACQVFDRKASHLLRDEYRIRQVTKVTADSLEGLASRMSEEFGVDAAGFLATVDEYHRAVDESVPFNPNVKDGRRTRGLAVDKTNWANRLDTPPFEAYAVTCGITFTFGGVRITPRAQVMGTDERPIPGLYACGELVGGIFYFNYPGGSGLTAGAVFGRIAGSSATVPSTGATEGP